MMVKRIAVLMISFSLCGSTAQADVTATGNVHPNTNPASWTASDNVFIGYSQPGSLTVNGDSDLFSRHSSIGSHSTGAGVATVNGAGSTWTSTYTLVVGSSGDGTLEIANAGAVSNTEGYIGKNSSSTGTVTVSGGDSTWTNSDTLFIGEYGHGTLNISSGGSVSNPYCLLGKEFGATGAVTVSGTGSTWTSTGSVYLGEYGRGSLEITNGGTVSSLYCYAAHYSRHPGSTITIPSSASVKVSGSGSTWTTSKTLYLGGDGDARLDIDNGGAVSCVDSTIGRHHSSTSAATVRGVGSTWTITDDLRVGEFGKATLDIYDGGLVSVASTLTIDDDDDGDAFINMGSGGMLALPGDTAGSLADFRRPIKGSEFTSVEEPIRYWKASAWAWTDLSEATAGVDYTLNYHTEGDLAGYTVLTVITAVEPPTPGDTNNDHIVDHSDCENLIAQFGGAPGVKSADFNDDLFVGLEDFAIMRGNFGSGIPTAPNAEPATITPEPATLTLLVLGGLAVLRRRRS